MTGRRCFVVGLDGGSWNVIQPLLEERKLPNLEELLRVSCRGRLCSTVPPLTCPAWLAFSTGLKPSRLGIYGFRNLRPGSNRLYVHSYAEVRQAEFWDFLMESGLSCGIINNPLVYPRKRHRGYIIPGFLTPQEEFRSLPTGLLEELHRAVGGYEVDHFMNVVDDETLLEDALRVEEKRAKVFAHLLEKYPTDLFLGVFTSTDRICHRFLNRAILSTGREREKAWEAIAALYRKVDEGLGVVMEAAREDDLLVVMSDHGFAPRPWNFHLNQYLKDRGLLTIKVPGRFKSMVFTQRGLARALNRLGLLRWAGRKVPEGLRKLFPKGATNLGEIPIHDLVDEGRVVWERTRALAVGYGIYLNTADRPRGTVDKEEAEALRLAIREDLEEMRGPEGKLGLCALELREAYGDPDPMDPPDLILVEEGDCEARCTLDVDGRMFTPNLRAGHASEGIIIVRAPGVDGPSLDLEASIEEVAGLILRFFAIPAPPHMESRLADKFFPPESESTSGFQGQEAREAVEWSEKARIRRRVAELKERGLI